AALVLGLLAFCLGPLAGIPAIILATLSLGEIGRGRVGGKGLAITGLVLGILGCFLGLAIPIGLLVPAVQKTREAAQRLTVQNNMKQMSLAMINDADMNQGRMTPYAIFDKKTGKPLLSWRVAILPYIEQDALYNQFHLDEPWDSPNNSRLI